MFEKSEKDEKAERAERDKEKEKQKEDVERGAKDDWEALKIVLDGLPSLKQRVLHKIRSIKDSSSKSPAKISMKQQREFNLQNKKKQKEGGS